jgi:hypothetical protein
MRPRKKPAALNMTETTGRSRNRMEAHETETVAPGPRPLADGRQGMTLEMGGENPGPVRLAEEEGEAVPGDRPEVIFSKSDDADGGGTANHGGEHSGDLSDPDVQLEVYQDEVEGFRKDGRGYKGLCPFHSDHEPSLRVNLKDGKWLWFCHPCDTGGNAFELLKRLGKPPKAAKKDSERKDQPTATYDYTDKDGTVLFQALRFGDGKGKTFRQRQPDGKGGWIWSVPEDVRTLYNLPEVTRAEEVFIVEGEKDVETARRLGVTATTNALGAGKWLPKYSQLLAGKNIVLIPDNDKAGEKHRYVVLKSLCDSSEHPTSIKVVQLPKGKDLTEWVEAGGNSTQLNELVDKAERFAYVKEGSEEFVVIGKLEDPERDYGIVIVCKDDQVHKYKGLGFETVVWDMDDEERLVKELAEKSVAVTFQNEAVVAALLPAVQSLKVVRAAPKTAEEFLALVAIAVERRIRLKVSDADQFLEKKIKPREVLMETRAGVPVFYRQSINQLWAWRGTGKTYVVLGMVRALVRGENFLTWKAKRKVKVLYVEGEIPEHQMQERLRQAVGKSNGNLQIITLDEQPDNEIPSLLTEYGRKLVEEALGDAEVLVLDSISTLFNFATNEEEPWLEVMAWLKKLRSKGLCIIFLHHAGKSGVQRGSSKSEDLLDVSIKLAQPEDYRIEEGLRANLTFDKTRGVAMIDGEVQVAMTIEDDVAEFFSSPIGDGKALKAAEQYERAKPYLDKYPKASLRELEQKSSGAISKSTFQRHRQRWRAEKAAEGGQEDAGEQQAKDSKQELSEDSKEDQNDESEPFRFIGAEDQQKKPPARELSPFAKRALAEAAEWEKKKA